MSEFCFLMGIRNKGLYDNYFLKQFLKIVFKNCLLMFYKINITLFANYFREQFSIL